MKRVTGLKILLGALVTFILILLTSVFFLQTMGLSPSMVEERINAVLSKTLPLGIKIGEITGNPLTGYDAGPLSIHDAQTTILSADKLHVSPSLINLLQGELRLSELHITGVSLDYDRLNNLLRQKTADRKESTWNLPVDKIRVTNLRTTTPQGKLIIEKALVKNKHNNFTIQLNGSLDEKRIKADGELLQEEDLKRITAGLEWDTARAQVDGVISPSISLKCTFKTFDLSKLHYLIPAVDRADLRGITSGSVLISKKNNAWDISGDIETPDAHVWKLPVSELKTRLAYANRQLLFRHLNGNIFGSPISGDISLRFPASKDFELDIKAQGNNLDLTEWHNIANGLSSVTGKIDSISIDIKGPIKKWQGDVDLFSAKLIYDKKYTINDTNGKIALHGEAPMDVLFLGKLYGGTYEAGGIFHSTGDAFHLPLSISRLNLELLARDLPPLKKAQITGTISAKLVARKSSSGFDVEGTAESSRLSLNTQKEQLISPTLDFKTDFKTLTIKRFATVWRGSRVSGEGNAGIANPQSDHLSLRGRIERLSLASFSDRIAAVRAEGLSAVAGGAWLLSGSRENPELRFTLSSPSLRATARKLSLSGILLTGRATLSSLFLEQLRFSLGKTPFSLAGSIQWPRNNNGIAWDITGRFSGFPVATLRQQGIISSDVTGTLNGEIALTQSAHSPLSNNRLRLRKSSLTSRGVYLRDINGSITQSGKTFSLQKIQGNIGEGRIELTGSIAMPQNTPQQLHLKLHTTSMDIGRTLRLISPRVRSVQGVANSTIELTGSLASPRVGARLSLHRFFAYGFYLPRVDIELAGTPKEIRFKQIKANVGSGTLNATAELKNTGGVWNANMQAKGKKLNVRVLSSYLPDEARKHVKGILDFTFTASGTAETFKGTGLLTSPSLSIYNITSHNIKAPFYIQDRYFTVEDASASIYGGQMKLQLAADLHSTKWGGRVDIKSADLTGLIRDVIPDSTGSITGKTDFSLRIAGDTRRTSLLDGTGRLSITDGEVTGFPGVDTLSKAMGNKLLLFKSVISTFTVDGKNLYILPGSRVTAPPDHEAYRYLLADGSANLETGLDLNLIGNVNVRALNIFLSAVQGVISSGTAAAVDTKTIISGLLGNVIKGYSSKEFRDVQFTVRGKPGQFYFGDFAIAPSLKQNFRPDALNDPANLNTIKEQKFMLNIEIPVGYSSDKRKGESVKDQVKGQVLLQAIQGILNGVSFGD